MKRILRLVLVIGLAFGPMAWFGAVSEARASDNVLEDGMDFVTSTVDGVMEWSGTMAEDLWEMGADSFEYSQDFLYSGFEMVSDTFNAGFEMVGDGVTGVTDFVTETWDAGAEAVTGMVGE